MNGKKTKKNFKVVKQLPDEILQAVNEKLAKGYSYPEILAWLKKMGHNNIGYTALRNYGKNYLDKLERLRIATEQAREIIKQAGSGMELEEASTKLALQLILEVLLEVQDLKGEKISNLLYILATLQRASVMREKYKLAFRDAIEEAKERIIQDIKQEVTKDEELQAKLIKIVQERTKALKREELI